MSSVEFFVTLFLQKINHPEVKEGPTVAKSPAAKDAKHAAPPRWF